MHMQQSSHVMWRSILTALQLFSSSSTVFHDRTFAVICRAQRKYSKIRTKRCFLTASSKSETIACRMQRRSSQVRINAAFEERISRNNAGKRTQTAGQESELPDDMSRTFMDDWPLIWKNFQANDCVTFYAEDNPDFNVFFYLAKGFQKQPTHHYFRFVETCIVRKSLINCNRSGPTGSKYIQASYIDVALLCVTETHPCTNCSWIISTDSSMRTNLLRANSPSTGSLTLDMTGYIM